MLETALKSIHNWRRCLSSKCYGIDENVRYRILRSAVAPSDAAQKRQYGCTTTVPLVYNSPKDICENLLSVWLLGRTNLFISSRFWTTYTKFDNCCQLYIATCGKKYIDAHPHSRPKLLRWIYFRIAQLCIWSGAYTPFRRFLDFSHFSYAIWQILWRRLATKMRNV